MESYTTSVMPPQDPMSKFSNNCTGPSSSSGMASSAHGPAPHARHNSHGAISHQHFPGNKGHVVVDGGQAQAQTAVSSFQPSSMRVSEQRPNNSAANGSPATTATTQQQQQQQNHPHSYQGASSPGESAQSSPYHPQKQQQQQHIPRPLQQTQQPLQSQPHQQQQQHPIPEHHHIQYPSYKDPSNPYPATNAHANANGPNGMLNKANGTTSNSNSSSNNSSGMARSHTHSLSHPHLQFAPYQEQNQKQQYQQPQQQHFNGGFQQGPPPQQHHQSPFRPPGSHIPHSMSMPMKPPTPTRMHHLQFGPGGPLSYDRRGSLPGSGYPHPPHHHLQHHHDMDKTMDSDGSSGGDSGDESFGGGGGGGGLTQGAQWTRQEDILLREAVVKFNGKAWKRIAEYCFPDGSRDKDQCLQRWRMISKPRSIKGPWTPEEDRQLRMLVNELGAEKWVLIASRLGSRTGKQCRERWHNHLDPKIDKSPFTAKEDELIFKLFAQFGSKWAEMSKLMPGRPDNAIKNHFNTSMQRKRRRLSLQDPSELQMKGEHGPSNGAVSPPLASPTSATSPSVTRHNRFDPYERRHSMPSLEFSPKAYNHHHHPHHHHSGSRDYSGEGAAGGHPYHQPPPPPHHNSHHHHQQQQQPQHPHQQQQQQQYPNGPGQGPYPRTIPTPPKTPDTKGPLKFAASMSRSISLGSSDRMGMPVPGGNANGRHSHHHQHSHSLSHNGPVRPNLPGISSLHSPPPPPPPPHCGSNNHSHHLYSTSTMAAMVPPSSSTTASLASPSSSSSTPPSAVLMARSSSAMGISNETPSPFYNRNPRDAPFNPNQQQQQQSMRPGFPRPNNNMVRHDSAGGNLGRFVRGHEHHRSLDIDPFSALAELANLADQQRQAPGSGSPASNINKCVTTTTSNHHGATTVVVQSSEENDEYNSRQQHHQRHQRRGCQGGGGGESMSRSGSGSSIDGPDVEDVEDAVIKTMIERPLVHTPAPTQGPPASGPLARRFSTLGHVKEEEHGEEGEEQHQQHQHSYHIDPRINNTNNGPTQGTLGHSKSYSGHALSSGSSRDLSSSMTGYRSKRLSVDFSILSDPASDGDEDDDDMVVDGADGGARYYQQQQSHYNQQQYHQQQQQQQYRYPANKQQEGSSSSSPTSPGPSAAYLSMRRGSVRELMAIDHLCLSSEEVERC